MAAEHPDLEQAQDDHDLLLIVAHDVRAALIQLTKQNGRIAVLETWQLRVVYTVAGALLMSPLAFEDARKWIAQLLGG